MLDEEILHQMGDLAALPDLPYVSPSTLTTTTTVDDNSNLPINNISELMAVVEFLNKYGHGFLKVGVNSGDADWLNFCKSSTM